MIRLWKPAALAISVITLGMTFLTTGCGSGSTQARLMNAMNDQSSVSMLINNTTVSSGVAFGTASGYASASSGSQQVQIKSASATLLNQTVTITGGDNNTVLATNSGLTVLTDNKTTPSSGNIQIRAVDASTSISPVDVYIVSSTNPDISTVNPTATLNFQAASGYQTLPAGSYQIIFTESGQKIPIINSGSLSFSAGQIRTVVSLDFPTYSTAVLSDLN